MRKSNRRKKKRRNIEKINKLLLSNLISLTSKESSKFSVDTLTLYFENA